MSSPIPSRLNTRGYKITALVAFVIFDIAVVATLILIFTGSSTSAKAVTAPNPELKKQATALACVLQDIDPSNLDGYFDRVRQATTGEARKQVDDSERSLRAQVANAPGNRVNCTVNGVGVISESGDTAEVLAFTTSTLASSGKNAPQETRYTLVRQEGKWLISRAESLTTITGVGEK